mmetsp:Transcript_14411/g.23045  ORF Transcript_14411/g.23045 Transcript_14411/m.23045 type:complete len:116 (+) Transcript_14411:726-1073(+)
MGELCTWVAMQMGCCAHGQHGKICMQAAAGSCAQGQHQGSLCTGTTAGSCANGAALQTVSSSIWAVTGSSAHGQQHGAAHMGSNIALCTCAAAGSHAFEQQQGAFAIVPSTKQTC